MTAALKTFFPLSLEIWFMVFILLAKRLAISIAGINLSLLARIICAELLGCS